MYFVGFSSSVEDEMTGIFKSGEGMVDSSFLSLEVAGAAYSEGA